MHPRTLVDVTVVEAAPGHTFRPSVATHLIEAGQYSRTVQEEPGHTDVMTRVIHTHVRNRATSGVRSLWKGFTERVICGSGYHAGIHGGFGHKELEKARCGAIGHLSKGSLADRNQNSRILCGSILLLSSTKRS